MRMRCMKHFQDCVSGLYEQAICAIREFVDERGEFQVTGAVGDDKREWDWMQRARKVLTEYQVALGHKMGAIANTVARIPR